MTTSPENYSNGSVNPDFTSQLSAYRPARRDSAVLPHANGEDLARRNGSTPTTDRGNGGLEPTGSIASSFRTPELVEPKLDESIFSLDKWKDTVSGESLTDHPLLRGLLMELPPKGSTPPQEWLDRWFEAARSILELLYAQHAGRR
ncbi:hypothetical protein HC028_07880 [Planosporangium flavigriseum]|uniref:Uncharacterized protein n=1 Tax=Planosporangium flavigriseum TaxID=373681 RepID=A0A8J3LQZ3_9ACTN|nr:hypothetical protein [Planosporangium flavigriseum]NJC64428.1 hypothetical protein [Planosporangium flavigriseum]GIG72096.1 hypothetical protein Pfl04_05000 [Planosporangium flavigriseum]